MSNAEIIRSLKEAMNAKQTPTAYDSSAVVTRIEGNATAWVKIAGSDTETPVKLTIDAKTGDTVQVRVGGGSAWLTGNQTAPPTDNTKANEAMKRAEKASGEATNFVTDTKDGIFVHPKDNDRDGVRITDAIEILKGGLSFFRAWIEGGIAKVRVGREDAGHTDIDSYGMTVYGADGTKQLAKIGCSTTTLPDGTEVPTPHYDFGVRTGRKAAYSMVVGSNNVEASADTAFAIGQDVHATDYGAHAGGNSVINNAYCGFAHGQDLELSSGAGVGAAVFGHNNLAENDVLFAVGNGTDEVSHNAMSVYEDGTFLLGNRYPVYCEDVTVNVSYEAGTIGTRGATIPLGTTNLTGYKYIGASVLDHRNTSLFSVDVVRNSPQATAHLCAYRASGNAVSNAAVTVRKIWVVIPAFIQR